MNLRALEVFLAVAEKGGFAAAGESIGLTQSAVSIQIKTLEESLDTILFDRSKRPPVLNDNGVLLVEKSRQILEHVEKLQQSFTNKKFSGSLHIGSVTSVLTGVLPNALASMKKMHPRLLVKVISDISIELVAKVKRGEIDGGIISEPLRISRDLKWISFATEPLVMVSPPGSEGLSERELFTRYPFLQFAKNTRIGKIIESDLSDRGIKVQSSMEIDSLEAISLMVAEGLGVSIVPQRSHTRGLKKKLIVSPFGKKTIKRVLGLVYRANNPNANLLAFFGKTLSSETSRAMSKKGSP
jgi:DNA-binding transcriptional LysR family regulator